MQALSPPIDSYKYCVHKAQIDGFCEKCNIYLCKDCQIAEHYEHIQQIQGLDRAFTQAIQEYSSMISTLDKYLNPSIQPIKEGAVDEALLFVEKKIGDEYDKLSQDIKDIEEEQVATLKNSPFLSKLQKEKEELEGEELDKISKFDQKLGITINKLLNALNSESYEEVLPILTEQSKSEFTKEAQEFEGYYEKQKKFMKHLDVLKSVAPKLNYDGKVIQELVQVRGVHEDIAKWKIYDIKDKAVYTFMPKLKTIIREEIADAKMFRGCGQCFIGNCTLLICGGKKKPKEYIKSCYTFSEGDTKFVNQNNMNYERAYFGITSKEDHDVYVAGGENNNSLINLCEKYSIADNKWENLPNLCEAKKNLTLCFAGETMIVAIGGFVLGQSEINSIELFRLPFINGTSKWEKQCIKNIEALNSVYFNKSGAIEISENQILIFGGKVTHKPMLRTFILDTNKMEISEKAMLPVGASFKNGGVFYEGTAYAVAYKKKVTLVYDAKENNWGMIEEGQYNLKKNWGN